MSDLEPFSFFPTIFFSVFLCNLNKKTKKYFTMLNDTYYHFLPFSSKSKRILCVFLLIKLCLLLNFYVLFRVSTNFLVCFLPLKFSSFSLCGFFLSNFSFQKSTFAGCNERLWRLLNGYFFLLLLNCYFNLDFSYRNDLVH